MNIQELKELDTKSLQAEIEQLQERYANQQEAVRNGKEKNFSCLKILRHDIARALTVLKEKENN